jgi:hypothetical protein
MRGALWVQDNFVLEIPEGDEITQPRVAELPWVLYEPRSTPTGLYPVSMPQSLSSVF